MTNTIAVDYIDTSAAPTFTHDVETLADAIAILKQRGTTCATAVGGLEVQLNKRDILRTFRDHAGRGTILADLEIALTVRTMFEPHTLVIHTAD